MSGGSCLVCGNAFPAAKRGRPRVFCANPACGELHRAWERVRKALPAVVATATPDALVDLRYELFCFLGDEIPRVRTDRGTFRKRRIR